LFVSEIDLLVAIKIREIDWEAKIARIARCQKEAVSAPERHPSFRDQGQVKSTYLQASHWTHSIGRTSEIASRFHSATS